MAAGSRVGQALAWILEQLHDDPACDRVKVIDDASRKFDLSPLQADFLFSKLIEAIKDKSNSDPEEQI